MEVEDENLAGIDVRRGPRPAVAQLCRHDDLVAMRHKVHAITGGRAKVQSSVETLGTGAG